jgi:glycosyltransferase involved in cell wall biosynthesis
MLEQSISKPTVVVIPAFNEETTISSVIETMPRDVVDRVIVVDDASTDGTSATARSAGATVVRHGRNLGVGAAIKSGYSKALSLGAEIILVVAGDGQHEPQEIPALIQPILSEEADYVVGDRLSGDPLSHGMPRHRYYGNKLLTYITAKITKLDVKDSQCGFTAISRHGLKRINLGFLSDRWGIPNDMLLECAMRGLRVKYVPVKAIYEGRKSYIKLPGFGIRMLAILARGILRYVYFYRGTVILSTTGGLLIFIGLGYGILVVSETLTTGRLAGVGSVILAVTLLLTGIQLLVFGLLAEMIKMMETRIFQERSEL